MLIIIIIKRQDKTRQDKTKQDKTKQNKTKQELNNIIDNFTTNFMDITYHEVVSFLVLVNEPLHIVRP